MCRAAHSVKRRCTAGHHDQGRDDPQLGQEGHDQDRVPIHGIIVLELHYDEIVSVLEGEIMTKVWLVRNDTYSDELEDGGFISIGWDGTDNLDVISLKSRTSSLTSRSCSPKVR